MRQKSKDMKYSMNAVYRLVGVSKQAVYQYAQRQVSWNAKLEQLVCEVEELRKEHPGCGVEKMYYALAPDFIGRDRFISLFMSLGYRVKRERNYRRTTYSKPTNYPNLIPGILLHSPSQVWQSDITYFRMKDQFYYGVFILDVYTRKIVGHCVSRHLRATANVHALKMALQHHPPPWIHHSDKGSQFTYTQYIGILKQRGCQISMCDQAQENAYAERIHLTLKEEYLAHWHPPSFSALKRRVGQAVKHYNTKRIHNHIGRKTPQQFESEVASLSLHNRPMAMIYAEGQDKVERISNPLPFIEQPDLMAPICPNLKYLKNEDYK